MRQITLFEALMPIIVLITGLYVTIGILHVNLNFALVLALLVSLGVAVRLGTDNRKLIAMVWHGVKPAVSILLLFLLIGALIGIWHLCGTIPAMIYYGLLIVHQKTFYMSAFIITCIISMLLGTSLGTVSTVGIALLGIAHSLGLSTYVTAGAVISGAFLGDRSSPVSSSANLTAAITGSELYTNLQYMIATIVLPLTATTAVFFWLGRSVHTGMIINQLPIVRELAGNFNLNWLTLMPPLLVLVLSLGRVSTRNVLITGTLAGILVALWLQNSSWLDVLRTAILGYAGPVHLGDLRQVIKGGGMVSFVNMDLVIICSAALTGVLEGTGALKVLLNRILDSITSARALTAFTMIASIFMAVITANQTLAIIIPAKLMIPTYQKFKLAPKNLARALADSGVMIVPLIPWNVAALLCAGVLGVSTLHYLPFTLLCWLTPLTALIFSLLKTPKQSG